MNKVIYTPFISKYEIPEASSFQSTQLSYPNLLDLGIVKEEIAITPDEKEPISPISNLNEIRLNYGGDNNSNKAAWNDTWKQFGSQLGLKDEKAYLYLLGQLEHESSNFKYMEEIASGKAYEGRADLGNTEKGDGTRYKGRGPIQVTGKNNYKTIYENFFIPNGLEKYNIVEHPELGSDPKIGSLMTIGWFLTTDNGKKAIQAMNNYDVKSATKYINGGYNGLTSRENITKRLLKNAGLA